jgi:uncharacterized protein YaaR (DUF327 family)
MGVRPAIRRTVRADPEHLPVSTPVTLVAPRPAAPPPALWAEYRARERALVALPTADRLAALKRAAQALVAAAMQAYVPKTEPVLSGGSFRLMVRVAAVEDALDALTLKDLSERAGVLLLSRIDYLRGLLLDLFC